MGVTDGLLPFQEVDDIAISVDVVELLDDLGRLKNSVWHASEIILTEMLH